MMQMLSQTSIEIARAKGIPLVPNPVLTRLMAALAGGLLVLAAAVIFVLFLI